MRDLAGRLADLVGDGEPGRVGSAAPRCGQPVQEPSGRAHGVRARRHVLAGGACNFNLTHPAGARWQQGQGQLTAPMWSAAMLAGSGVERPRQHLRRLRVVVLTAVSEYRQRVEAGVFLLVGAVSLVSRSPRRGR
jgi:hypothetical protein